MKYIISLMIVFVLSNCEVKVRESKAQEKYFNIYSYTEEYHNNMKFGIWYVKQNSSQTGYSIIVVNLTKDSLEVEYYKKMLRK